MARIPSVDYDNNFDNNNNNNNNFDNNNNDDEVRHGRENRAFLTPLELRNLEFPDGPPECPVEDLYLGRSDDADKVDAATLEMLRRYLPFARASYGLNLGAWKACTKYRWYHWGYRWGHPRYFREKNFEMLLEMMGVRDEADVLHASYDAVRMMFVVV